MQGTVDLFLKQEKEHMRDDEIGKFYFLEEEEINKAMKVVDSNANDMAWVSKIVEHKLREIEHHAVLPYDETVTFQ